MNRNVPPAAFYIVIALVVCLIVVLGWRAAHKPSPFEKLPEPPPSAAGP